MYRCLQLAENGCGNVSPNPLVGSVIVYNNKIIGEGYHIKAGEAHAEVNAIHSVINKDLLSKSTLYVNLEPCAHFGKTPPCADLIIQHKIPNVIIGCSDPFSKVAGKGIEKLRNAGINVTTGILEEEAIFLNRRFFTFHTKKRPYIILKWAQTIDKLIDRKREISEKPSVISNQEAHRLSHLWRSQEDSIMIGTNTAIMDNPNLTTREVFGKNPIRVVLDQHCTLSEKLNLFNDQSQTIVFNNCKETVKDNIEFIKLDFRTKSLQPILNVLYQKNIQSIIVEGGAHLISSFLDQNLWDEVKVFVAPNHLNNGVKAPQLPFGKTSKIQLGDNNLLVIHKE